ncbi:hypothetical protein ACWFR5_33220 [Streptomyces sp. NPDC055092]
MRPIRAACLGTATALVALLAGAPGATAAKDTDSAHAKGGHRVITVIGHLDLQSRFPVNPKGPAAQGDRTVFRSNLFDKEDEKSGSARPTAPAPPLWPNTPAERRSAS